MHISRTLFTTILLLLGFIFSSVNARPHIDWSFSYNFNSTGFVINDSESISQENLVFVASTSMLDFNTNGDIYIKDEGERKLNFDRVHMSDQLRHCIEQNTCTHNPHGIIIGHVNTSTNQVRELTLITTSSPTSAYDLEVDNSGNIYVVGSIDRYQRSNLTEYFPARNILPSHNDKNYGEEGYLDRGREDGFIIKLNSSGELLVASYYGGSGSDTINEVTTSDTGYAFVGKSSSSDLHITDNSSYKGDDDGFLVVTDSDSNVVHSSYIGGTAGDVLQTVEDMGSRVAFAGTTTSQIDVTSNAFDKTLSGGRDGLFGFYDKYTNDINYLSYYGKEGSEGIQKLEVMENGDLYLGGTTNSPSLSTNGTTTDYLGPFVVKMSGDPLREVEIWSYSYERITANMTDMDIHSDGTIAVAASCLGGGLICHISFYPHFNMLEETSFYEKQAFDAGILSGGNFHNPSMLIVWRDEGDFEPWTAGFLPSFRDTILGINFIDAGKVLLSGFTHSSGFIDTTHSSRDSNTTFGAYIMEIDLGQKKNKKPQLVNDSISLDVDGEINIYPLQNDSDEDGYIIDQTFEIVDYPEHGQLSAPHIRVNYKPDLGYEGEDSFTYKARDDAGEYGMKATVSIQVGRSGSKDNSGGGSAPIWLLGMLLLSFTARRYYK